MGDHQQSDRTADAKMSARCRDSGEMALRERQNKRGERSALKFQIIVPMIWNSHNDFPSTVWFNEIEILHSSL